METESKVSDAMVQINAAQFDKMCALLTALAGYNAPALSHELEARELLAALKPMPPRPGVHEAVALLNELLRLDYNMVGKLVGTYADANAFVADHPTVQVGVKGDGHEAGFIGILNGLLTLNTNEEGYIEVRLSPDGQELIEFYVAPPPGAALKPVN